MIWLVARRELTRGRQRAYLVSLGISVLVIVAVALIPSFTDDDNPTFDVGLVGAQSQRLAAALGRVDDATGVDLKVTGLGSESEARRAVGDGDLDAAVVDNARVISDSELDAQLRGALQAAHLAVVIDREVAPLRESTLQADPDADRVRKGVAVIGVIVLFGQLIGYSNWVASGVVEEKTSRVVELLLATLRPWQLLAGKIIGIGLLALGQLLLVMASGLGAALAAGSVTIPAAAYGTVAQVLGWFVLGYGFFAATYAAAASLVSRQEEVASVTGPVTMVMMAGYFAAFYAAENPQADFSRLVSFVPPLSAMTMPGRSADGSVHWWEVVLAALLMLLATVALVRLAGRVYSGAVLRTGPRIRLGEALRTARQPASS